MEPTQDEVVNIKVGLAERLMFECETSKLSIADAVDVLISCALSLCVANCHPGKEGNLLSALLQKLTRNFLEMYRAKLERPSVQ